MLQRLIMACLDGRDVPALAREQAGRWEKWLAPITPDNPVGMDPGYDDDFQRLREEVNKLSGIDTALIGELAEALLTTHCKDVRVATYYVWARLHQEGERGLAEGLGLLVALTDRFGDGLLPRRAGSRKAALEWLMGTKIQDSLSLYPEVNRIDFEHILASLALLEQVFATWDEDARPSLTGLVGILEKRLDQSGGVDALVPQTTAQAPLPVMQDNPSPRKASPVWRPVQSGRDLLEQARELARYLRDQPRGWLSSHAALSWLGQLPGINGARHRWLQRLLMARVAEQYGRNEVALHLLTELNADESQRLGEWEPALMFEVKASLLKLLRMKAQRSEQDKAQMAQRMETLLEGLVAIDPVRAAVLCG
ncbi:TssA family type VI secretion system protein [Photorhabdus antumapuensis]|uniref:TssA family type VI secretion system protein n=1 Tax=Photorhabdus antumapuensis TaxID=2862867 RepID=UPI001CED5C7B|nr:TssA family type VI secretion system protein [Photorhabdus antumapuensis]MCA6219793.1 TssA family type VI secretion system protein [Photorhabdus antumapuensis]